MKNMLKILGILGICFVLILVLTGCTRTNKQEDQTFHIVTSFYPMYIMTLNITSGANDVEVKNMADTNLGCIHDYTLKAEDLKKFEKADVFIQNGLGLEGVQEKILQSYPDVAIFNTSDGITGLIKEKEKNNEHIWTSISIYVRQVENIKNKLIELNPQNRSIYEKNAQDYIAKLHALRKEYSTKLEALVGQSAICLDESFAYLGQDLKMDFIMVETSHEESTLSGEMLANLVKTMKERNITKIIISKEDSSKSAETLQRETGAKIYKLDAAVTGNMGKDSYLESMKANYKRLLEEEW